MNEKEEAISPPNEYERRRAEKERVEKAKENRKKFKRFVRLAVWLLIAAALVYAIIALIKVSKPQGEDSSHQIPILNQEHIEVGSTPPGEYNSNPPTSGWHYQQTARNKFYDEPVPDQYLLHNLEHGDVWVAYHPRLSKEVKDVLKKFVSTRVIASPRPGNETDIALAAWGRLDAFNLEGAVLPENRISDFIKRYTNKGPEKIPLEAHGRLNFN